MITLRPVERDDLHPLFRLKVTAEQDGWVAPNEFTLAQAPYETGAYVFAIRNDDEIVGLLAMIDFREHAYVMEGEDREAANLWRLLIGADHQNKGYGRAAMGLAFDWARARGNPRFGTSVVPENAAGLAFYRSLGLEPTGLIVDGETVLSRDL
ncbi:GNAT family N-acetyltransferase [Flavimaricola marinus]|uniref:Acetyltransferase (GNAT) family protein n=1 Tax=Flavimaricola marinus TaxID=1819565 RepID=A0A238LDY8_9RHOB|nr:GNAT family N-acetyltransferase [Flavimaricola marinus]SMY07176.1 Acetyltransferase (GNAT) family protein [Flavimaricola marinus]